MKGEASEERTRDGPLGVWGAALAAPFFIEVSQSRKFAAVTIATGQQCCEAVGSFTSYRILATEVAALPLRDCTLRDKCHCRFKKFDDRREDDQGRRFKYGQECAAWYAGSQRRRSYGRRDCDGRAD
jgi:hypothetical protein